MTSTSSPTGDLADSLWSSSSLGRRHSPRTRADRTRTTDPGRTNMRLLRERSRRKLRTTLTIVGITIGIWALVVFSAMANQINGLVEDVIGPLAAMADASSIEPTGPTASDRLEKDTSIGGSGLDELDHPTGDPITPPWELESEERREQPKLASGLHPHVDREIRS
jgi:hypothetical protein